MVTATNLLSGSGSRCLSLQSTITPEQRDVLRCQLDTVRQLLAVTHAAMAIARAAQQLTLTSRVASLEAFARDLEERIAS